MISEKLKQARTQKGFSQEKLAAESGLSLRTVQRVENAETDPRGDTLMRLARVGKQIINFQITWIIVFFAVVILNIIWMYHSMMELGDISPSSVSQFYLFFTVSIAILYGYNIFITGINIFKASQGQEQWYHPKITFIS